jgi:hypothetical protein
MLSLRHSIGNTSLVGTELGGVPKAYRIPVAMPALPALKSAPENIDTDMRNDTPPEPLKLEDHLKDL